MATTTRGIPPAEALSKARAACAEHRWRDAATLFATADHGGVMMPSDFDLLGEAAWWTGDMGASLAARERAYAGHMAANDRQLAARTALMLAGDYNHRLEDAIASGFLSRAQSLLEDTPISTEHGLQERARLNMAMSRGALDEALEHADRVLDIGTRLADRDLMGLGLHDKGRALVALGRVEEGMALLEEAMVAAIGGELSPHATAVVYCNATIACEDVADYRRAADFAEAAKRWCERQQIAGFPGMCRVRRAEIIRLSGAWEEAESEARQATDELRSFALDYAGEGFYQIGEIRLRLGDFGAAESAFRKAHELGRDPEPGLALLRLAQGDATPAHDLLRESLDDSTLTPLARARLLPALVEVAVAVDDPETARKAAAEMGDLADKYGTHALRAAAASAFGQAALLGGSAEAAAESFRRARRIWHEINAPYETARARAWLGQALLVDGRAQAAALELRSAMATFERLGAGPDLRWTQAILERVDAESTVGEPASRARRILMFTDVVRSTDLIDAIGDEAWNSLRHWHDQTIRHVVIGYGGELVDHTGDGFFVAFSDPDHAIECAIAIRQTMRDHRRDHGFAPAIRIGLHAAEATKTGAGYSGRGVHVAARIAALAVADEIVISEDALAATRRSVAHGPLRPVQLKGIRHSVRVGAIS